MNEVYQEISLLDTVFTKFNHLYIFQYNAINVRGWVTLHKDVMQKCNAWSVEVSTIRMCVARNKLSVLTVLAVIQLIPDFADIWRLLLIWKEKRHKGKQDRFLFHQLALCQAQACTIRRGIAQRFHVKLIESLQ